MGVNTIRNLIRTSKRPLDIIYVIDISGSMEGEKILSVNRAMHELETELLSEAQRNPSASVNITVVTFGNDVAQIHGNRKVPIEDYSYSDITYVNGSTPFDKACNVLCDLLSEQHMDNKSYTPVVVLLSDGEPSYEYKEALNQFLNSKWGAKAIKYAIACGKDADINVLASFTTSNECVLSVNNAKELIRAIKWTSSLVSKASNIGHTVDIPDSVMTRPKSIIDNDDY
jgi:uncharacterized protein YegL